MAVKNHPISIKYIVDTREQDTYYVKDILDQRLNKDGICIKDTEVKTCKPLGCRLSVGDGTVEYRLHGSEDEWIKTKFCLELKKKDLFSSIYTKASFERLMNEIDRAKENDLYFIFVATQSIDEVIKEINKIPRLKNTNAEITFFENFMKLQEKLRDCGFLYVTSGRNGLAFTIRRLIKRYVKSNKLQQKVVDKK